jgi:hypothetical protein
LSETRRATRAYQPQLHLAANIRSARMESLPSLLHALTGVLAVALPLLMVIIIPIVAIWAGHQRQIREVEARHRERMAAIEKGLPVPADPAPRPRSSGSPLLRGLVWLGIGLAIVYSRVDDTFSRLGWIPAAIGAAFLIFYVVESLKGPRNPPSQGSV